MWSFETDPEFQASLDWIDEFTQEEIEPLDLVFREPGDPWDPASPAFAAMAPLREDLFGLLYMWQSFSLYLIMTCLWCSSLRHS